MSQNLQSHSNVLTAARQTMMSWSKRIESREDIPAIYKDHFDKLFGSEGTFPLVILTPALDRFPRKTTEKLICDTDNTLHVLEKIGNQVNATSYLYSDVYGLEFGNILLDSWLTIRGKTNKGDSAATRIEFNTTSKRYFEPILSKLRPSSQTMDKSQDKAEKDKFNSLSVTNFKFMNYGRESLVPGETIQRFVLQAEIHQPLFTLLGKTFYKTLSLTHLSVLTDQELILIQETGNSREGRAGRYGGIWQYIPLHAIHSIALSEVVNDRLTLSIRCQPDRTVEALFDISNLPELHQFRDQLQLLLPR